MWVHVKFLVSNNLNNAIVQCLICLQEHVRNVVLCKETSQKSLFVEKAQHDKKGKKSTESARPRTNKVGITSEQVHV